MLPAPVLPSHLWSSGTRFQPLTPLPSNTGSTKHWFCKRAGGTPRSHEKAWTAQVTTQISSSQPSEAQPFFQEYRREETFLYPHTST